MKAAFATGTVFAALLLMGNVDGRRKELSEPRQAWDWRGGAPACFIEGTGNCPTTQFALCKTFACVDNGSGVNVCPPGLVEETQLNTTYVQAVKSTTNAGRIETEDLAEIVCLIDRGCVDCVLDIINEYCTNNGGVLNPQKVTPTRPKGARCNAGQ
jgi:hypothetical protein